MAEHRFNEEETFLYYQQPANVWVCPGCETELDHAEERCFMCGCAKQVWLRMKEEERRKPVYEPSQVSPQVQKSGMAGRIIAWIFIIALLLAIFYFASTAAETECGIEENINETEGYVSVV